MASGPKATCAKENVRLPESLPDRAEDFAALRREAERSRSGPALKPRLAASLILLDRSGGARKILMGRRHADHKFMPGKFVFPGGRLEAADRLMGCATALPPIVADKLAKRLRRPSPTTPRALALAAIRETYEETGILLGAREPPEKLMTPPGIWRDFVAHGVWPDLAKLKFIARAITPPGRPRRFDTYFFAIDANEIVRQLDGAVSAQSELVELVWMTPESAIDLDLPTITKIILKELDRRIEDGLADELPVPFFHERNRQWRREEL